MLTRRSRALRHLEAIAPNPRGKSPFRPVRRGWRVMVRVLGAVLWALVMAGAVAGGMVWLSNAQRPVETAAPGGGFHACGNGRWVRDAERCG